MSWRLASRLSVITLALLVVVILALWGLRTNISGAATNQHASGLSGTDLGNTPAPNFHLTDQYGQQISLSQFRGDLVILTFMYTRCPDVCPLTAEKLHTVQTTLGKDASKVVMLAVSVDPTDDTQAAALTFSQEHRLTSNWHFLIGTQSELSPVWSAYSIYAQPTATTGQSMHSEAVYLIDQQGHERVLLDDDFTTTEMTSNLKLLLNG
jgi:protein SCO1/2